jgi:predicted nucleic acid-binding protein
VIVLDASVVVEMLTNGDLANSIRGELYRSGEAAIVPHLLDVEVLSAIRGLTAGQRLST